MATGLDRGRGRGLRSRHAHLRCLLLYPGDVPALHPGWAWLCPAGRTTVTTVTPGYADTSSGARRPGSGERRNVEIVTQRFRGARRLRALEAIGSASSSAAGDTRELLDPDAAAHAPAQRRRTRAPSQVQPARGACSTAPAQ